MSVGWLIAVFVVGSFWIYGSWKRWSGIWTILLGIILFVLLVKVGWADNLYRFINDISNAVGNTKVQKG